MTSRKWQSRTKMKRWTYVLKPKPTPDRLGVFMGQWNAESVTQNHHNTSSFLHPNRMISGDCASPCSLRSMTHEPSTTNHTLRSPTSVWKASPKGRVRKLLCKVNIIDTEGHIWFLLHIILLFLFFSSFFSIYMPVSQELEMAYKKCNKKEEKYRNGGSQRM